MNFGPYEAEVDAPLAPADWFISFASEILADSMVTTASLSRVDQIMCRLTFAGPAGSAADARQHIVRKARIWVADYLLRSHTGQTGFGPLEV